MSFNDSRTGDGSQVSVVVPTLRRPELVQDLLKNLADQSVRPAEVIVVDGSTPPSATERVTRELRPSLPFEVHHVFSPRGTARQRNVGIDRAAMPLVALIDDDIRLDRDFLAEMISHFSADTSRQIGAIAGHIRNQSVDAATNMQWRLYRRMRAFTHYEPGWYDFGSGYPVPRYLATRPTELRAVNSMGAGCAVWRRNAFDEGLRFDEFFSGYGMLEDIDLSLRASGRWKLFESGRATCVHLRTEGERPRADVLARKSAVNHRYLFVKHVPKRSMVQECRFWYIQLIDLCRYAVATLRGRPGSMSAVRGKAVGIIEAARRWPPWSATA